MSIDIRERLADQEKKWEQAEAADRSGSIPDGEYQATVARFDFHESKKDGTLRLQTEFEILSPAEFEGRKISTFHALEGEIRQLGWTKSHLEMLGVENINPLADLEDRLPEALDKVCDIAVRTRTVGGKSYTNVYLNRVLDGVKASPKDEPAELDNDDIPF